MEEKKILQTIRRKANWIGHIFHRNFLLKHATEGKTDGRNEVTGRRRRCKQLLDDLKQKKRILETERQSTWSKSVENSLWACCKAQENEILLLFRGGACSSDGGGERRVQGFGGET
jgi:hypothetical protein